MYGVARPGPCSSMRPLRVDARVRKRTKPFGSCCHDYRTHNERAPCTVSPKHRCKHVMAQLRAEQGARPTRADPGVQNPCSSASRTINGKGGTGR